MKFSHIFHKTFNEHLEMTGETGTVVHVTHPIVYVDGLPNAKPDEVIHFESGELGIVFALTSEYVSVLILSSEPIHIGTSAVRTSKELEIPLGKALLGRDVNSIGRSLNDV